VNEYVVDALVDAAARASDELALSHPPISPSSTHFRSHFANSSVIISAFIFPK
jgi:hypothetical protein